MLNVQQVTIDKVNEILSTYQKTHHKNGGEDYVE